ncbi:hypothetical protein F8279_05450 [Micromonospora sp. AMSO1212t]|uniref:hypothetical protein n=1 Tax=Micromonospora sp. AMSO1212t TaxID=2650565 RepID=UPI00124AF8B5|nr:hypothetical protein [Micromonospora sp. AMSO1212t]KAB1908955.1 hypothetical protein F8279_05450 [Micromonospora sp. AMSO1212t]
MKLRRRLVAVCLLLALEAAAFALLVTESVTGAIVAAGLTCVSLWLHLVLHECGHLVVAKLLGLPVVAVRIAPFNGWRNEVSVRPSPSTAALPLRMVLFYLGGPLANLSAATALVVASGYTGTALTRLTLLGAAFVGALLALTNLVPGRATRSDGQNLFRWLRAPAAAREGLGAGYYQEEVVRALRAVAGVAGDVHRVGIQARAGSDPLLALAAYQQRLSTAHTQSAELVEEAERLAALARAGSTDPATAAAIGQMLSVQFGLWYLYAAVVTGSPVARREVREISELAGIAARTQPHAFSARIAMSLAHLLNQRPEDARSLLLDVRPATEPADLCAVALLLRAAAESYLGNHADADHLLRAAGGDYPQLAQLVAAIRAADPAPPLFAPLRVAGT